MHNRAGQFWSLLFFLGVCLVALYIYIHILTHYLKTNPNSFGHVSPTSAAHVLADLGAHDLTILEPSSSITNGDKGDGQNGVADAAAPLCRIGIESTVAKVDAAGGVVRVGWGV